MLCAAENLTLSEKDKDKQNYLAEKHFTRSSQGKELFGNLAGCYAVNSLTAVACITFGSLHVFHIKMAYLTFSETHHLEYNCKFIMYKIKQFIKKTLIKILLLVCMHLCPLNHLFIIRCMLSSERTLHFSSHVYTLHYWKSVTYRSLLPDYK